MKEVLDHYMPKIRKSEILKTLDLRSRNYFLVSTHREENVDNPSNLEKIILILEKIESEFGMPVIVSTHPRTQKRLDSIKNRTKNGNIRFLKPFGFTDYINLQMNACCTISDSGTISEESAILSFPAISLRQSMERPEAQDAGTIILTGFEPERVLDSIRLVIEEHKAGSYKKIPDDYTITNTSMRVLKLIMGNAGLSNLWHGVRRD
jgi:UDP-N-acetylglucosamine 2-epimerase (non-hydrolysing)